MNRRNTSYIVIGCCLALGLFYYFFGDRFSADTQTGLTDKLIITVKNKVTSFNIITTNDKSVLHYKRYNFFDTEINLSEFDSGAQFCPDSIYASPKIANSLVCVIGEAGVHSQKIELFDYLNGKLNKMMFTDKLIKSDTLDSDVPKFSIVDYNNDKLLDVTADFRDYDTDPLKQGIRYFYKNDQNSFIYDKQEKVSY